jgi:hypothetical protein
MAQQERVVMTRICSVILFSIKNTYFIAKPVCLEKETLVESNLNGTLLTTEFI